MYFLNAVKGLVPYKNRRIIDVEALVPVIKELCETKEFIFRKNLAALDHAFGSLIPAYESLSRLMHTGRASMFELEMIVLTLKTSINNPKMLSKVSDAELVHYKTVLPALSAAYQAASSRMAFIREHNRLQDEADMQTRQLRLAKWTVLSAFASALAAAFAAYAAFVLTR